MVLNSAFMKCVLPLLASVFLTVSATAQITTATITPLPKKKMLGIYNTSTLAIMPVTRSNNAYYPYYDALYYPMYGVEKRMGFSFRNTTGYRFFDILNVGGGVGVDNYESSALSIPFYGEVSGNFLNKRFFPSYYAQAGYGLAINISEKDSPNRIQKADGGLMAAVGIGFGGRLDNNTILRLNFGYRLQKTSYTSEVPQYNMPPYILIRHMTYHRIEVGLNFTFQQ